MGDVEAAGRPQFSFEALSRPYLSHMAENEPLPVNPSGAVLLAFNFSKQTRMFEAGSLFDAVNSQS